MVGVTDIGGNVVYRFEYSAYGEIFEVNSDNELDEFTDFEEIVYGFQGRRFDSETDGLMYFRNRYYNSKLGRFIQRDPLQYVDSYGLYEAFRGNSFSYTDPFGESSNDAHKGIGGVPRPGPGGVGGRGRVIQMRPRTNIQGNLALKPQVNPAPRGRVVQLRPNAPRGVSVNSAKPQRVFATEPKNVPKFNSLRSNQPSGVGNSNNQSSSEDEESSKNKYYIRVIIFNKLSQGQFPHCGVKVYHPLGHATHFTMDPTIPQGENNGQIEIYRNINSKIVKAMAQNNVTLFDVPVTKAQAQRAAAFQNTQLAMSQITMMPSSVYSETNNCTSHVIDVLNAAGLNFCLYGRIDRRVIHLKRQLRRYQVFPVTKK